MHKRAPTGPLPRPLRGVPHADRLWYANCTGPMQDIEAGVVEIEGSGLRIAYDAFGSGPEVVLCHGARGARWNWRANRLTSWLAHDHRLILIDALGHGESDKPCEPAAYTMERRARHVVAVLDELTVERVHFVGYSMGGHTGFALLAQAPARLRTVAIGGMGASGPVLAGPFGTETWGRFTREQLRAAAAAGDHMAALGLATRDAPDYAAMLEGVRLAALYFCGTHDDHFASSRAAASATHGASFLELPGLTHKDVYKWGFEAVAPALRDLFARAD